MIAVALFFLAFSASIWLLIRDGWFYPVWCSMCFVPVHADTDFGE